MDHRADIWSLGVIVYECLAGRRPIEGENVGQVLKGITMGNIALLATVRPDLPPELTRLVERMLSRAPEQRPALAEIISVFSLLAGSPIVDAAPASLVRAHPIGSRRTRWAALAVALVATGTCGSLAWHYHRASLPPPPVGVASAGTAGEKVREAPPGGPGSTAAAQEPSPIPVAVSPASSIPPSSSVPPPVVPKSPATVTPHASTPKHPAASVPSPSASASSRAPRLPGGVYGESPYP